MRGAKQLKKDDQTHRIGDVLDRLGETLGGNRGGREGTGRDGDAGEGETTDNRHCWDLFWLDLCKAR